MPSSADVAAALDAAAAAVLQSASSSRTPLILIDGRSGAGKTTIARAVAERLDAQLLALDSLYPGWDGLASGAETVRLGVLLPFSRGQRGHWHRWDWQAGRPAEEHVIEACRPLVVEGAGVLTPQSAELADVSVWLESPLVSRRRRALDRDGDDYAPHWNRWAAQEDEHLRVHRPDALASIVVEIP